MKCLTGKELEEAIKAMISDDPNDMGLTMEDFGAINQNGRVFMLHEESSGKNSIKNAMRLIVAEFKGHGFFSTGCQPAAAIVHFKIPSDFKVGKLTEPLDLIHGICHDDTEVILSITVDEDLPSDHICITMFVNERDAKERRYVNNITYRPPAK